MEFRLFFLPFSLYLTWKILNKPAKKPGEKQISHGILSLEKPSHSFFARLEFYGEKIYPPQTKLIYLPISCPFFVLLPVSHLGYQFLFESHNKTSFRTSFEQTDDAAERLWNF